MKPVQFYVCIKEKSLHLFNRRFLTANPQSITKPLEIYRLTFTTLTYVVCFVEQYKIDGKGMNCHFVEILDNYLKWYLL